MAVRVPPQEMVFQAAKAAADKTKGSCVWLSQNLICFKHCFCCACAITGCCIVKCTTLAKEPYDAVRAETAVKRFSWSCARFCCGNPLLRDEHHAAPDLHAAAKHQHQHHEKELRLASEKAAHKPNARAPHKPITFV
jgi:hypothetical protein